MSTVGWCDHGVGEVAVYDIDTEDAYCVVDGEGDWAWPEDDNVTKQRERAARIVKSLNCHDDLLEALKLAAESAGFQYMTRETRQAIDAAIAKTEAQS